MARRAYKNHLACCWQRGDETCEQEDLSEHRFKRKRLRSGLRTSGWERRNFYGSPSKADPDINEQGLLPRLDINLVRLKRQLDVGTSFHQFPLGHAWHRYSLRSRQANCLQHRESIAPFLLRVRDLHGWSQAVQIRPRNLQGKAKEHA